MQVSTEIKSYSWKPPTILSSSSTLSVSIKSPHSDSPRPSLVITCSSNSKSQIPIIIKPGNGKEYRYVNANGNSFELVSGNHHHHHHGFVGFFRDLFIPKHVTPNYIHYLKFKFFHRLFSSALQVLATQAMFRAIGVGYAQSLPSAAALNWVLKDGLGRLSRCIYTAWVGSAFDTNLKRVRFATSVMFSLSIGVELMTPAFPNCFLLLASFSNIAKQISLACYLATGTAVHRSFAIADNLGEVSAKAQIQTVCFDNLGLLVAASLNVICRNNQRLQIVLPFVVYPIFSAIDLCAIYQSLKHVHLQTLTKDRLEIILNSWLRCGCVPSPSEVSKLEGINLFKDTSGTKRRWPIRIGCLDPKRRVSLLSVLTMTSLSVDDYYFICSEARSGLRKSERQGILVALREGARMKDIISGLLQACYIREAILSSCKMWENIDEASDISHSISRQWVALIQSSKHYALNDQNLVLEQIVNGGWAAKNVLLGTQEQARYDFVDENI